MTTHDWQRQRVFVTGATGFLGSWLVNELIGRGADVAALVQEADPQSNLYRNGDVEKISVVIGDLEDYQILEKAIRSHKSEVVFHLGAQAIVGNAQQRPLEAFDTYIRGTYNLLEACRINGKTVTRVIIASSDKAYGQQPDLPYTEDMPLQGRFPYEVSKSCADLIAQSYYHAYGLPVAIARCGNTFGGGDLNWNRIVPGTIKSFLTDDRPIIRSDGLYVRDYIYVQDVVQAYILMAEHLGDSQVQGEAFNLSNESPMTVLDLFQVIRRLLDCDHIEPKILDCAEGEIHAQYLSAAKARALLGWEPQFTLEQGLANTIEWYRRFLD